MSGGRLEQRGYRVCGRVQGVGFRWWTRSTASALELSGMVRNVPDGSVEVQAYGPVEKLTELERCLTRGPGGAKVDGVDRVPAREGIPLDEFRIDLW